MRYRSLWIVCLTCVLMFAASGSPGRRARHPYTPQEHAFYLDDATVEFVRPGLQVTVQAAAIASDGTISAAFKVADPAGLPLDLAGVTSPGTISLSFIAAYIPAGHDQYVSYITRAATGAAIPLVNQPAADSGGTTAQTGPGQYTYTFKAKATGVQTAATNTIGIYGSRNLTLYNLGTNYASTTFNFVPNGSAVTTTRDVVRDATCDHCHDQLSFHGGFRRGVALCVMCHTSQNADPVTGNSLDFSVMTHKIHLGSQLPSVKAGKAYQFVGYMNAVTDYSKVVDPADARRCTTCHDPNSGAKQANTFLTKPTRTSCGSCHDNVNFDTGLNHIAGAYPDDTKCASCHQPQGASDFDSSITGGHVVPVDSSLISGLTAKITNVANGTAGSQPTVTFTLRNNGGQGVPVSALSVLQLTMAGPTTSYGSTIFSSDTAGTPGYVTENATGASCAPDGTCTYKFSHAIPTGVSGTFAVALEGRRTETVLPGQRNQMSILYGAFNPVSYFSVDGSTVTPPPANVTLANCNQCHILLSEHGSLRNNTEYCVMCHNPSNTDALTRAASPVAADKAMPPQGIDFNLMVHRIHFGENAASTGPKNPYVVVGFGGSKNDFSGILYSPMSPQGSAGDTRNCAMCHVNNSQLNLPLGASPVADPQGWINPTQAIAGACTGCHTSKAQGAHYLSQTSTLGESCTVCHSSGAVNAVDKVHAQY